MISEGANGEEERTEGEGAEGAVGGGVRVAADAGRAGQREALLRPDDVHDALPLVRHAEVEQVEGLHVLLELHHLRPRLRLCAAPRPLVSPPSAAARNGRPMDGGAHR